MPTVYLTRPGLQARVTGSRIELDFSDVEDDPPTPNSWIPLIDVEMVVLDNRVRCSANSVARLAQENKPVLFLSNQHFPAGMAVPMRRHTESLARQLDASRDESMRLACSRWLVEAKILNMRRVLQRLKGDVDKSHVIGGLKRLAAQALKATSLDSLRGFEGAATGTYFSDLAGYFPDELPFVRRTRRPPRNEANAILSFLYTLLCSELALHIYGLGLEPGWGVFHETEAGRPSLALDLMEPFRSPLVDSLALDMINHRRLAKEDFQQVNEGYFLRKESRRKVFGQWENRLEREFHYTRDNRRTSLRNLLKEQCLQVKRYLECGKPMRPFRMN
jgi:CRISP-associated protein Cas1